MKNKRWGVILAGGDGIRLLPLTRALHGDDRPKQFSRVVGGETLVNQTRARVRQILQGGQERTLVVVTRRHEPFYREQLEGMTHRNILVQPFNHGTSQAILYSLLRIASEDPDAVVSFFPSDHHFSNSHILAQQMEEAYRAAESGAGGHRVVLLGVEPDAPETSYGWIEPSSEPQHQNARQWRRAVPVRRFWEKPSSDVAMSLMQRGCLWNSFIMTGRVSAFLHLFERTLPGLLSSFRGAIANGFGSHAIEEVFGDTPASNFSSDVLARVPEHLAVLSGSRELGWSDLGEPDRVTRLGAVRLA